MKIALKMTFWGTCIECLNTWAHPPAGLRLHRKTPLKILSWQFVLKMPYFTPKKVPSCWVVHFKDAKKNFSRPEHFQLLLQYVIFSPFSKICSWKLFKKKFVYWLLVWQVKTWRCRRKTDRLRMSPGLYSIWKWHFFICQHTSFLNLCSGNQVQVLIFFLSILSYRWDIVPSVCDDFCFWLNQMYQSM